MRVCLDAHMLGGRETGNETYVAELAPALARLDGVECVATIPPHTKLPVSWGEGQPRVVELRPAGDWPRLAYTLPRLCRNWRADILHVSYNAPFTSPCPIVVTVHDVIYKRFPAFFSVRDRILFATLLPLTLRRASAIITDSESSRKDVTDFYPSTTGKVYVVPLAASSIFRPVESPNERQKVCARYGIGSQFILAVGNLQPRKNLTRLVEAFRRLLAKGVTGRQLVLVGKDTFRSSRFRAEAGDLIQSDKLVLTAYVPNEDLPALYSAAAVFVYPSIYEGFGLPPLEAMACGTPVVCSNTSSLPEVVGDAAITVDPADVGELACAIRRVLIDGALRTRLREAGLRQAALFSWPDTARRVLEVYRQVLEEYRV